MENNQIRLDTYGDMIAVGAEERVMQELSFIEGAKRCRGTNNGKIVHWVSLPPTRSSILCAESMGDVATTQRYNAMRTQIMRASTEELEEWYKYAPVTNSSMRLTETQTQFCAMALDRAGMLNGSEQGTGKTIMTIALLHAWRMKYNVRRILLIPMKTGIDQWRDEFTAMLQEDDLPVYVKINGTKQYRAELLQTIAAYPDAYVVAALNYEMLDPLIDILMRFKPDAIVFDESWKIKNPSAVMTKAALRLTEKTHRVLCLNGTPAGNHAGDFYTQIATVAGMEYVGKHSDWLREYTEEKTVYIGNGRSTRNYTGSKNEVQLMRTIEPFYWRATKASSTDLPAKLPTQNTQLRMLPNQMALYMQMKENGETLLTTAPNDDAQSDSALTAEDENELAMDCAGEGLSLAGAVVIGLRLAQICSGFLPLNLTHGVPCYANRVHPEAVIDPEDEVWRFPTPKDVWLRQWTEDTLKHSNEKVIIWCNFNADVKKVARYMAEILGQDAVVRLYNGPGGLPLSDYPQMRESFNRRDGKIRVIVAQIKKVAFGQNLQGGDHNIYYSHTWRIVERMQSEDRTHRMGRVGLVSYRNLLCTKTDSTSTIDGEIVASNDEKMSFAARLVRDTALWRKL